MRTAVRFRMWQLNSSTSRRELGLRTRRVWISVLISGCREVLISIILFLYKKRWSGFGSKTPKPQRLFFQLQNAEVIAHFFKNEKFFLERRFSFQPAHSIAFGSIAFPKRFNQLQFDQNIGEIRLIIANRGSLMPQYFVNQRFGSDIKFFSHFNFPFYIWEQHRVTRLMCLFLLNVSD
nr:MAG TPA: hypothetical protein [Caudoviricetes sp.]